MQVRKASPALFQIDDDSRWIAGLVQGLHEDLPQGTEDCAAVLEGGAGVSDLADMLSFQLKAAQIAHQREVQLIPERKFRTDIVVYPRIAVECDGGTWNGGRHSTGSGIETDSEKQNLLVIFGYRPMRVTKQQIKDGRALRWIERAIKGEPL